MSSIWTAGSSDGYRIGRDRDDNDPHPIFVPPGAFIKTLSASWKSGCYVTSQNEFYSWGSGQSWRLGTGNRSDSPYPQLVSTFPEFNFQQIVSGDKFSAALSEDGSVLVWGAGYAHSPTKLKLEDTVKHIAAGQTQLMCALSDGRVAIANRHKQVQYIRVPDNNIVKVAIGTSHYLALSEDGVAYSWGGESPATGQPKETLTPTQVPNLPTSIQSVFAYHNNSWFVDIDGSVYCCGANTDGSLGIGNTSSVRNVLRHPYNFGGSPVIQISCGDDFTLVLNLKGQVFAAGNPADGRTMVTNPNNSSEFQECTKMVGHNVTQISCGCYSSALLVDGALPLDFGDVLIRNFREFRMQSSEINVTDYEGKRFTLTSGEEELTNFGLQIGDILFDRTVQGDEDKHCMVIGTFEGFPVVIREEDCKIYPLKGITFDDVLERFDLLERENSELAFADSTKGYRISVDQSDSAMTPFNGLKVGDIINDGSVISGARGFHLFAEKDKIFHEITFSEIISVSRENNLIEKYSLFDGRECFVKTASEKGTIIFDSNIGAVEFVGQLAETDCFSSPGDFGLLRTKLSGYVARTNKEGMTRQLFLETMEHVIVNISLNETMKLGFACFDVVETKENSLATVLGTKNDKVAIRLEKIKNNFGCIKLVDKSEVTLIGRINCPGERIIDDVRYSVNTQDFKECKVLPSDVLELENGDEVIVVGAIKGKAFVMKNDEKPFALEKYKRLVRRNLPVLGVSLIQNYRVLVSYYSLGFSRYYPGSIVTKRGKKYKFLGVRDSKDRETLFLDMETQEILHIDSVSLDLAF
ncbi:hypothetical protein TVAG_407260 [Trichomonas vaginalis G3]|uniref:Regulator of chromosome condensation family protein n=1 Tax=Trichomonas vaginalis (strain ATCC PRA-98 / G3) TaxID=412133 RepID=A2F423_TRIV3|nr:ubiquitin-protein transferase protein [Trichomonas vaginalis G3]EAY00377.1 hypothetical protein TVAG_407260 [Trichomonas vaginalis G3]KAI5552362.1 ubiquitin-protein transferase protein [Trichomonas vaginalis G3]|eukprot:XP_001313306.1 hypothetical protein [Trichomonas vaginalis G3]